MSTLDLKKTVHIIVHGQTNLVGTVKEKLIGLGFSENSLLQASLDKVGNEGDYVALAWPPMTAKQIILNEITGIREDAQEGLGMLSLIHISEPTRLGMISYAVFCL